MAEAKLTGGEALAQALARAGVDFVFGIPGGGQYEAVDGLYGESTISYIATRHEQAASYMADGYARVSGRVAVALVVPGPGLCNAASGLLTAAATSSPMLVVTGTRPAAEAGRNLSDELAKWVARPQNPGEVATCVWTAVEQAQRGRPQPVIIEISQEVLAASASVDRTMPNGDPVDPASRVIDPDAEAVREAALILSRAQKPVLWAGAGVQRSGATRELQALAEKLSAPVVTTRGGKGAISDRHPLSLGYAEVRYAPLTEWLASRDAVLAVGARFGIERLPLAPAQQLVRIDTDDSVMSGGETVGIVADAAAVLTALAGELCERADDHAGAAAIHDEVRRVNQTRFDPGHQLQPQWDLMQTIRTVMPDDGILVQGMNQLGYYSRNYYPVYAPRSYLTSSTESTLGCAYPLALGAKLGAADRAVVALCGDGGFLYNAQEMATAARYGIGAVAVVFNDNAYGNVLRAQLEQFGGRVLGTRLHNPDFVTLAASFGVRATRASGAAELGDALRRAIDEDGPALIEVPVGQMERVY